MAVPTDDGGPAFPSHGSMGEVAQEGMALRDYFAAKAMQALIPLSINTPRLAMCDRAYEIADGMLEAKGPQ